MVLSLLVLASPALAGERFHAWTYDTDTVPVGGVEIEHYATVETHHEGGELVPEWEHQIELETGITGSLESGLYVVATQTGDGALTFSGYKARLRYRFWPVGSKPVDLGAYLEYVGTPTFDEHELEAKILLAKESDSFRSALNLTAELHFGKDGFEPVYEPTFGFAYRATPHVAGGVEAKMEGTLGKEPEGPLFWAGPSVHLAAEGGKFWWTLAGIVALTGPTREDAEVEARSLVAVNF